jgi:hypothetical protein
MAFEDIAASHYNIMEYDMKTGTAKNEKPYKY